MILVLLGTQNNSFHRLLEEIQKEIDEGMIKDNVIVQAGKTEFESKEMEIFSLCSYEALEELVDKADYVITHGGVGSITMCLKKEKKVIAVPRQKQYAEHVNDHQLQIVQAFDRVGYIKGLYEICNLSKLLKEIKDFVPKKFTSSTDHMMGIIEQYIEKQEQKKKRKSFT